jgi:hypothetical protein
MLESEEIKPNQTDFWNPAFCRKPLRDGEKEDFGAKTRLAKRGGLVILPAAFEYVYGNLYCDRDAVQERQVG